MANLPQTIGIIGGGTMGRGLAQLGVSKGFACTVLHRRAESCTLTQEAVASGLQEMVAKEIVTPESGEAALARLTCTTDPRELAASADLVIENIPEDLEAKKCLFKELGPLLKDDAILATNTSSLPVTALAAASGIPARVIGLHFFNPPAKMKLLEIVVPETTSEATYLQARALGEALGKTCIRVKDSPGFATSRLSVAVGLEALRMLEEGVASAADIDTAMEEGYRWPMGPLKLGDWVGLDVRLAVARELHRRLGTGTFAPPRILEDLVAQGRLGRKTGSGIYESGA